MNVCLVLGALVLATIICKLCPSLADEANHIILPFFLSNGLALPPSTYWTRVDNGYPVVKFMQTLFEGLGFSSYLTKEEEEFEDTQLVLHFAVNIRGHIFLRIQIIHI